MAVYPLDGWAEVRAEERLRFLADGPRPERGERMLYLTSTGRPHSLDQEFWGDVLLREMRAEWIWQRCVAAQGARCLG